MATPTEPACAVLQEVLDRLRTNREHLDRLLEDIGEETLRRRPAPDAWSAVECFDHLRVTAALYRLEAALAKGRARGVEGRAPYGRGTWTGRFLLSALDPARAKPKPIKAPRIFRPVPQPGLDATTVVQGLREENEHLRRLAAEADGLDLGRLRLASPVSFLFRLTVDQAFRVLARHETHHLAQAERALDAAREN